MPKKKYKDKKEEGERYRRESEGNESFREFMYKVGKQKRAKLF